MARRGSATRITNAQASDQPGPETVAGDGADTLVGGPGNDLLAGLGGNDTLIGGNGTDTVTYASATAGVSVITWMRGFQPTGGAGDDVLIGGADRDRWPAGRAPTSSASRR